MKNILNTIMTGNKIYKINENLYRIETNAVLNESFTLQLFIKKEENGIKLCDNKQILRYMNDLYELTSLDVKKCINDILKLYDFKLVKGEIFTEIDENTDIKKRYMDFIMCAAQLINMYVFFDTPND